MTGQADLYDVRNGRLGFRTLDEATLSPALQKVWEVETAVGLPMAHRICMQFDL